MNVTDFVTQSKSSTCFVDTKETVGENKVRDRESQMIASGNLLKKDFKAQVPAKNRRYVGAKPFHSQPHQPAWFLQEKEDRTHANRNDSIGLMEEMRLLPRGALTLIRKQPIQVPKT